MSDLIEPRPGQPFHCERVTCDGCGKESDADYTALVEACREDAPELDGDILRLAESCPDGDA